MTIVNGSNVHLDWKCGFDILNFGHAKDTDEE